MEAKIDSEKSGKFVDAKGLAEALWDEPARPHIVTIRNWTRHGKVPFFKIGGRVFFDIEQVKALLNKQATCNV